MRPSQHSPRLCPARPPPRPLHAQDSETDQARRQQGLPPSGSTLTAPGVVVEQLLLARATAGAGANERAVLRRGQKAQKRAADAAPGAAGAGQAQGLLDACMLEVAMQAMRDMQEEVVQRMQAAAELLLQHDAVAADAGDAQALALQGPAGPGPAAAWHSAVWVAIAGVRHAQMTMRRYIPWARLQQAEQP